MAPSSPTPAGPGSHYTTLGRRTSARQALRRPQYPSQSSSNRPSAAPASSNYAALDDSSSDEERLRPMKLSALTKALLGGDYGSSSSSTAAPISSTRRPRPVSPVARVVTRRPPVPAPVRSASGAQEPSRTRARHTPSPPVSRPSSRASNRSVSSIPAPARPAFGDQESASRVTRKTRSSYARSKTPSPPPSRPSSQASVRSVSSNPAPIRPTSGDQESARRGIRQSSSGQASVFPPSSPQSRPQQPTATRRVVRLSGAHSANSAYNSSFNAAQPNNLRNSLSSSAQKKRSQSSDGPQSAPRQAQAVERDQPATTPVVVPRVVRIAVNSSGRRSESGGSAGASGKSSGRISTGGSNYQDVPRSTTAAPRPAVSQTANTRMKRVGTTPGGFLSGPARRGRRRQSEEDAEGQAEPDMDAYGAVQEPDGQRHEEPLEQRAPSPANSDFTFNSHGSPVSARVTARAAFRKFKSTWAEPASQRPSGSAHKKIVFNIPPPSTEEPTNADKENQAPFEAPAEVAPIIRPAVPARSIESQKVIAQPVAPINISNSESRPQPEAAPKHSVLALRTNNAAQRPAPPPPKMSVVDTATTAAGASTVAQPSKKKQFLLRVNGRTYTRLDCLGRGGSGKVYRVSAESGKLLALKRVSLENLDPRTIKGFKGEIDLLQRLTGVSRVIQLIDHEFNSEKQILSLVLEPGEIDFMTFLRSHTLDNDKMDPVFVRYWWKEMLECVRAVHERDIVHSDLKPANFVIAQGRLKLIDFGIANAIQTDMTVNVHRDTQIGTPNYMSPESLMDFKDYAHTSGQNGGYSAPSMPRSKTFKLGKASDVWSLGCILYQLVYGQGPFAKISNTAARISAIMNWNYPIDFPDHTEDGVLIPPSLLRTMRRCLNRNQAERPTCEELLAHTDPFLYPLELAPEVLAAQDHGEIMPITQEVLKQVVLDVMKRAKTGEIDAKEHRDQLLKCYWNSCRRALGHPGFASKKTPSPGRA